MKYKSARLPKVLNWIFLLGEVLLVGVIAMVLFGSSVKPSTGEGDPAGNWPLTYGDIGLSLNESLSLSIKDKVGTKDLQASIRTDDPQLARAFSRELRPSMITFTLILGTLIIVICEFFRRFFRNVSQGNAFSQANIKNLHKIGTLVIVYTLAFGLFHGITRAKSSDFVAENVAMESLVISDRQPKLKGGFGMSIGVDNMRVHIDFSGILSGLVIVALGEAFRQGLRLKEENELTV